MWIWSPANGNGRFVVVLSAAAAVTPSRFRLAVVRTDGMHDSLLSTIVQVVTLAASEVGAVLFLDDYEAGAISG